MKTITHNLENITITLELHPSPVTKEQTKRVRSCPARKTPAFAQPSSSKEAEPVEAASVAHDDTEELAAVLEDFPTIPVTDPRSRRGKPHAPPITKWRSCQDIYRQTETQRYGAHRNMAAAPSRSHGDHPKDSTGIPS